MRRLLIIAIIVAILTFGLLLTVKTVHAMFFFLNVADPQVLVIEAMNYPTPPETPVEPEIEPLPAILVDIAWCESREGQFDENGEVVRGWINPQDIGKFQINLDAHGERAIDLGIDLFTEEGNTEFAVLLYEEQGTAPWGYSSECWQGR